MRKVHIFYYNFATDDGEGVTLGGVQTYLINLSQVFRDCGFEVHFYRPAAMDKENFLYGIHIHLVRCTIPERRRVARVRYVFNQRKNAMDKASDLVLFADDLMSCKAKGFKTISIQHGIFWDVPEKDSTGKLRFAWVYLRKQWKAVQRLVHSTYSDVQVCVDYNFVNWYRSLMPYPTSRLVVIPNFTALAPRIEKPVGSVNIVFARRFEWMRGSRVFCEAIVRILKEYPDVHVTLAGWGHDEQWLREWLEGYPNVEFTKYESGESLALHARFHIAVVPSIGSEGTSLSLLEAMSAQCAVVGSDVGGITNILIDGFNGLLVPAGDAEALYQALARLINDPDLRASVSERGYQTAQCSFGIDRWREKWIKTINEVLG